MILETKLSNLDNKPIKVNKKSPPRSINPDLTPLYFTAMFIGAKNSGKSYGLVKLLKFYEDEPIKDSDNNTLQIRTILFCPTANSAANPIFQSLKSLQEEDIILIPTTNKPKSRNYRAPKTDIKKNSLNRS